jgi:hypothetical protein
MWLHRDERDLRSLVGCFDLPLARPSTDALLCIKSNQIFSWHCAYNDCKVLILKDLPAWLSNLAQTHNLSFSATYKCEFQC